MDKGARQDQFKGSQRVRHDDLAHILFKEHVLIKTDENFQQSTSWVCPSWSPWGLINICIRKGRAFLANRAHTPVLRVDCLELLQLKLPLETFLRLPALQTPVLFRAWPDTLVSNFLSAVYPAASLRQSELFQWLEEGFQSLSGKSLKKRFLTLEWTGICVLPNTECYNAGSYSFLFVERASWCWVFTLRQLFKVKKTDRKQKNSVKQLSFN